MLFRPRHLRRYRKIAEVMARHGFGAVVAQLGLDRSLNIPRRLLRREQLPETRASAALHFRLALEELGPTFVKLGQIASTRPEILPPSFIAELSNLHDDVPPAPWESIHPIIEAELGAPMEEVFIAFDPTPIASASLGQVYAALLPDRTPVVVKVQRPDIEKIIATDLAIMQDLARLANERLAWTRAYDPVGLADEFSAALKQELDYRREGRNADRFRENFEGEDHLYVPEIYWEFTSRRILIQERIEGVKFDDFAGIEAAGYDRKRIAENASRMVIKETLIDGYFHADPHPGNLLIMENEVIGLMDFGTVGFLDGTDRANLVRLYIAIIQFDAQTVVDQLIRMGIADATVDERGLQRDLRRLLRKYYGLPLQEINAAELLNETQPIIYEHHLRIPSDYWLLIKTLVILEGVGKKMAPDFDVFEFSGPYVSRFLLRQALPSSWGPPMIRNLTGWADLVSGFPRQASRILNQVDRGQLEFRVNIPAMEENTRQMNRVANRVIMAILVGTLTVALALLIPSLDLTWPWNIITWVIVVGFAFVLALSFWLIISILRSNRR